MNASTGDGDQPGLWPLSPTTTNAKTSRATKVSSTQPALGRAVRPERRNVGPVEVDNLWGIDDVSRYLGIPKYSIYGWQKTGYGPPPIKIGKYLKWRPAAVVEWAKGQERPAG